jgi:hypothetical protein
MPETHAPSQKIQFHAYRRNWLQSNSPCFFRCLPASTRNRTPWYAVKAALVRNILQMHYDEIKQKNRSQALVTLAASGDCHGTSPGWLGATQHCLVWCAAEVGGRGKKQPPLLSALASRRRQRAHSRRGVVLKVGDLGQPVVACHDGHQQKRPARGSKAGRDGAFLLAGWHFMLCQGGLRVFTRRSQGPSLWKSRALTPSRDTPTVAPRPLAAHSIMLLCSRS